jgi:hypothetical protein
LEEGGNPKERAGKEGFGISRVVSLMEILKEHNARVFRNKSSSANMFVLKIKEDVAMWSLARFVILCQESRFSFI